MITHLKVLYTYRELLWMWTWRNVKVRYKQSLLGGGWAILQPLSLMVLFSIVFTYFVRIPTDGVPYPIFSYIALLPWSFLVASISFGVPSLVQNLNLVTKIYFPREILPAAVIVASLIDFLMASLVLIGMMIFYQIQPSITLLVVPLLLGIQILLLLGIVLFAAAMNVFYRDIGFVVPLAIQLWMYATPVIYPAKAVPERFRDLYMLNPMAILIEAFRAVALQGIWPHWGYLGLAFGISTIVFLSGYFYFKRVEWQFADII